MSLEIEHVIIKHNSPRFCCYQIHYHTFYRHLIHHRIIETIKGPDSTLMDLMVFTIGHRGGISL